MTFEPVNKVEVALFINDEEVSVGQLATVKSRVYFEFASSFIERGIELSPIRLTTSPGLKSFDPHIFEGLPGLFYDSLPDGWGRLLLDRKMRKLGVVPQQLTPLDRLTFVGQSGMGALTYKPFEPTDEISEPLDLDQLAADVQQVLEGESGTVIDELLNLNGSSAGARPKAVIGVDQDKQNIVFGKDTVDSNYEPWLIKFANTGDGVDAGAIEYVYALMARDAGIEMESVHLFPSDKNPGYFATKRFDRNNDKRIHCHSVCGLLHSDYRTPSLDYQDLIRLTTILTKDRQQAEKMFRLAVFNILAHNRDDHSKNFSFLLDLEGEWKLAPAYDLTFSTGINGEQSTMLSGKGKEFQLSNLIQLGLKEDFSRPFIDSVIDQSKSALNKWRQLALNYGVASRNVNLIQRKLNEVSA